jgi:ubiquinone biosynthesis protein UbiJ
MDPITGAIVATLAAGVASGAGEVGKKVVVDAYSALKAAIKKKYGTESKVAQAVTAVEEEPDFEPNQQALAGRVEQVDAAEDPELQELAQKLLEALEETSQGKEALGKYNIQIDGGQVGVIGDHTKIEGGIHFGSSKE